MNGPIRVLHVIGAMNCGGAENMIMNLYRSIDRDKIQFDFLVHTQEKCFFDDEIRALGGQVYNVPAFTFVNTGKYAAAVTEFFENHHNYAAVHGHIGSSACVYLKIAKKYGMFAIAHSHNTNPTNITLKNVMYRLLTLKTRKVADYFIGCSEKAGLHRFGKRIVSGNSYSMLKNAIETERFVFDEDTGIAVRKELGISDKFVIGNIGRFSYQKNHEFLIDVFAAVSKKVNDAFLLLVGDGELRRQTEKKVEVLGLQDKVLFTGVRKDANRLLQAMDCFVFPSHFEGLPVTVVEAQAAGLPCVISENITDEVCITDLVEKLSVGLSPEVWADVIVKSRGQTRRNMAEQIKTSGYDIKQTVKWLTEFYLNCFAK